MNVGPELLVPILLCAAGATWYLSRSRRETTDPSTLLRKISPGELAELSEFLVQQDNFLDSDESFWSRSGKFSGLLRKRKNAVVLVKLCQVLLREGTNINPKTIAYMTRRSTLISFLAGCAVLESFLRLFMHDLPHICARNATQLYWDMELRAKVLFRDYYELSPDLAEQLNTLLNKNPGLTNAT